MYWIYLPPRMSVTIRMMFFLLGNPYKPSFVTVGWGVDLRYAALLEYKFGKKWPAGFCFWWNPGWSSDDYSCSTCCRSTKRIESDIIWPDKKGWQLAEFLLRFHGQLRSIPLKSFGRESRRRRRWMNRILPLSASKRAWHYKCIIM